MPPRNGTRARPPLVRRFVSVAVSPLATACEHDRHASRSENAPRNSGGGQKSERCAVGQPIRLRHRLEPGQSAHISALIADLSLDYAVYGIGKCAFLEFVTTKTEPRPKHRPIDNRKRQFRPRISRGLQSRRQMTRASARRTQRSRGPLSHQHAISTARYSQNRISRPHYR